MNALKVHVERIVRPIRASNRRKDQWREELLAHLMRLYEEAQACGGDDESAATAAIACFGEAPAITAELQAGVSWIERWAFLQFPYASPLRRRLGESPRHYVLRATSVGLVCGTFSMLAVLAILMAARTPSPLKTNAAVASEVGLYLLGTAAILFPAVIANGLLCEQIRQGLERRAAARGADERRHVDSRIGGWIVISAASWGVAAAAMMLLLNSALVDFISATQFWCITLGTVVAGAPLTLLQSRDWLLANRRYENWDSLELDCASEA